MHVFIQGIGTVPTQNVPQGSTGSEAHSLGVGVQLWADSLEGVYCAFLLLPPNALGYYQRQNIMIDGQLV